MADLKIYDKLTKKEMTVTALGYKNTYSTMTAQIKGKTVKRFKLVKGEEAPKAAEPVKKSVAPVAEPAAKKAPAKKAPAKKAAK